MTIFQESDFEWGENGILECITPSHQILIVSSDSGDTLCIAIRPSGYQATITCFGSRMIPWCNHRYGDWQFFGEYHDLDAALSALTPELLKHIKPNPLWKVLFSFICERLKS